MFANADPLLQLAAPISLAVAWLLAMIFHRNRAAQVLVLLLVLSIGLGHGGTRVHEGLLRFVPVLLLACALLPEPRLLSKRNLGLLLVACILLIITLQAPEHVFNGLVGAVEALLFGLSPAAGALLLVAIAALLCAIRWHMVRSPMELGLAVVLLLAALACSPGLSSTVRLLGFSTCGLAGVLGVLYASYRMAFVDPLTNLPNRRALDETLMRLSGHYTLAMIDVDHFKQFNDTYGHEAGDVVLRRVGGLLRAHAGGRAFRYGGEEFCVVYPAMPVKPAAALAEGARAAVQDAVIWVPAPGKRGAALPQKNQKKVSVTISVGCADRTAERKKPADILKVADQAMYRAKNKGRNRVMSAPA